MSNLLDSASIVLTPTAYDNGKMLSVKPNTDLFGAELVTNGNFATDSDWNKGAGWTISGGKANFNTTGNSSLVQNLSITSGKKYRIQITGEITSGYLKLTGVSGLGNDAAFTLPLDVTYTHDGGNNQIEIRTIGASVGYLDNVSVKEDLSGDFDFSRNSAATRVNAQGLVENVQILSGDLVSNGDFSQEGVQEVSNGSFSQEGAEQVTSFTNGTTYPFSTFTSLDNNITSAIINSNFAGCVSNSISVTSSQIYKVSFNYTKNSGDDLRVVFSSVVSGAGTQTSNNELVSASGSITLYLTISSSGTSYLQLGTASGSASIDFSISNVSVKEVGQDWVLGTGWSIGDGKVISDGSASQFLMQNVNFLAGKTYAIRFKADLISGDFIFGLFPNASGSVRNVDIGWQFTSINVSDVFYLTPTVDILRIGFQSGGGTGFIGSVTNISVKEVGQDWTLGTGWSIGDDKAIFDDSANGNLSQNKAFTSGKKYNISFEIKSGSGSIAFLSSNGVTTYVGYATYGIGTHITTFDYTSGSGFGVFASSFLGGAFSITNISVIEITDDTNLPRINYEGFSYQDSLGSEEVVNGDFSDGLNGWSAHAGSTLELENGMAKVTTVGGQGYIKRTDLSIETGKTYFCKAYITNALAPQWFINSVNNPINLSLISENTYAGYVTTTGNNPFFYIRGNGTSGEVSYIDNVSVKEYLGQEVVPDSGCGSWLLEPQSTNLVTYSEDFSQSVWRKRTSDSTQVPIITSNYAVSPDGLQNASRIVITKPSTENDYAIVDNYMSVTKSIGDKFASSIYVKANSSEQVGKEVNLYAYDGSYLTLITYALTDNWARIDAVHTTTTATGNMETLVLGKARASVGGTSLANMATDFLISFAQLEPQSYATSYIPTNGAASTRLQDVANNSGNATLINSTEGVLYVEAIAIDPDFANVISLSDGTNTNRIALTLPQNASNINAFSSVNGVKIDNNILHDSSVNSKYAIVWNGNSFKVFVNGIKKVDNTMSGSFSANALTNVRFDRGDGGLNFHGKAKAVVVYKEALTDEQLTCLTTI